jgi:hypothetical protein
MIKFRTRVFPTTRRLARIHAMLDRFLHYCHACGGDVLAYPRCKCHCRYFGTLYSEFNGFGRQFATPPDDINALILGGVPPSLHGAVHFTGNGRFSIYGAKPSLILFSLQFMYRTPEMFCSVRWALLFLALLELADARTGSANLSWSLPGMHSFWFACHWKVSVGGTPTLVSCGVSAIWYNSRTMVRCALTRASSTWEHDR